MTLQKWVASFPFFPSHVVHFRVETSAHSKPSSLEYLWNGGNQKQQSSDTRTVFEAHLMNQLPALFSLLEILVWTTGEWTRGGPVPHTRCWTWRPPYGMTGTQIDQRPSAALVRWTGLEKLFEQRWEPGHRGPWGKAMGRKRPTAVGKKRKVSQVIYTFLSWRGGGETVF